MNRSSEPFYKWRNRKGLNPTQKKDKVQLRFAIASGLMVSMLAFCGVYTLVSGATVSTSTTIDLSAPIETPGQARSLLKHRLLTGHNATYSMDISPTAAPTEISHREGTCPGIPKPSANLYKCTRYEVARQNTCAKYFTEESRVYPDLPEGFTDGLGDCEPYSGEKGPYPPDDPTWYACDAALALCQQNGDDEDKTAIFDSDTCYCPAEVPSTCVKDSDCDGEGGKTMCFTPDMCDDDEGLCEDAGQCFKPGLAQGDAGGFILQLLILFYMFLCIAIVCDDLFVPALEVIAEKWELSNDVAGATLMAAGGSAPELFTALMGVFMRGDLGFSTIVGSAVFNVLFVIGMCAMFTPAKFSPLTLTWWPLARDCTYYIITLFALVIFMGDGEIYMHEAILQFLLYIGYVVLMGCSETLEAMVKKSLNKSSAEVTPEGAEGENLETMRARVNTEFNRPSTFRAGVLQLLTSKTSITDTAGIACVAKIKGDVYEVFDSLDENKNGEIDRDELKKLLVTLGTAENELTDDALKVHAQAIDTAGNGIITKSEFVIWYTASEERIASEMKECFDRFDENNSGTIDKDEIKKLLEGMGHKPGPHDIEEAEKSINQTEGELNFEDFSAWYKKSLFWDERKHGAEEAAESQESVLEGIVSGFNDLSDPDMPMRAKFFYLFSLPIQIVFGCCVPDCRPPGQEWKCYGTFMMSIVMIGLSSYFMVEAVVEVTNAQNLNIPTAISGMTIIAAGTSVPDLLSSVIVARNGHGDMAVSSSVGSNIFDVTVGIPIPWIFFILFCQAHSCEYFVRLDKSDLVLPTILLLIMVAVIIFAIAISKWQMTHMLGNLMFIFYFLYLGFAIANKYCFWISMSL
uniref:EF-hand domain-containing protein n=2 Tax=Florenciella parvula TaxID=236787 RepID=A0A7S2CMU7_9STRA|mmetsp:Transcript_3470/g.7297  ORF Transcript_3470/g.7297 Transcript_3470/m.7297 type:complete len:859 (+) Transcript_3470:273-2849(+)